MAVGELFIGAFITVLFEKLASGDLIRLARSAGIYSELSKWTDTLTQIQAVLADAGQKQIQNRPVQLWLNKLQHLAYEIDDVLDDMATEAMDQQLKLESDASSSNNTRKVLKFIPNKFHAFNYGRKMSYKLDEITAKLRDLVERKKLLGLSDKVESSEIFSRRLKETSLVDESKIIGREGDKEALLGRLLSSESSSSQTTNVNVVSIVGLGGIGKTTLAQLLYNDPKVKDHFELKAWVCISDEFHVLNITKVICQAVGGGNQDSTDLNLLQESLKEKLSKKRFLLVLDDVWNENYGDWEVLQRPFTKGAPGSKVLVTTRNTKVASVMDSIQTYPLELLSDEEALYLFAQHASGKQNVDVNRKLKLHGEEIIRKCGRLPLALRTLGRVFGEKSNDEEWEELLNSEIWNLENRNEILPALYLSYHDLSPHLKQMFAYCSLFPKDYLFDKDELVLLWMGEGFLSGSNTNKSMESFGRECFKELVSRSFFQLATYKKSQYTMHDLINDLARTVAGEFFCVLDDKNEALEKVHHLSFISRDYETYERFKAVQTARHLRTFLPMSVTPLSHFHISDNSFIELLPQLKFLRVLSLARYFITKVPKSIGRLKHMRYLNFSNTSITCLPEQVGELHNLQSLLLSRCWNLSSLPKSIGRLKHMRYLNFSNTKITCLPEQVGELHNLQSLLLFGCSSLSSLPNSISKLINLRHLDIADTPKLNAMPLGLDRLTGLQTLSRVIVGGTGEYRISDLKAQLHLRGRLSIEGLHEVKDAMDAKEADLQQKSEICDLRMEWSDVFDNSRNGKTEYQVLEVLRPSNKLASLEIVYYGGPKLPSWLGDPSFVCLTRLTLRGCRSCTCLPTLGHLPLLQKLSVESMYGLKRLGLELLGPSNSWNGVAFPSLKVLEFRDMKSWEEWSTSGGDIAGAFPCLLQMSIINCPKLESYYCPNNIKMWVIERCLSLISLTFPTMDDLPSTLKSLRITGCDNMDETWLLNNFLSSLESLNISYTPNLMLFPEGCLSYLTRLSISKCDNLESIPGNGYGFLPFFCLSYLCIYNCKDLKSFPHEHLQSLTSLEYMWICDCPSLDFPFPCGLWPPNLSYLKIGGLKKPVSKWGLQNFPTSLVTLSLYGNKNSEELVLFGAKASSEEEEEDISSFILPSSLTELHILGFKELESVSEGVQHLTCLQHLEIWFCPKLRDLPETLLPSLSFLKVYDCSPELKEKCTRGEGKYRPLISQIPHLDV